MNSVTQVEPNFNSGVIGNTNINMDMVFNCQESIDVLQSNLGIGFGDAILIEFPLGYALNHLQNTEVKTSKSGSGWKKVDVFKQNRLIVYLTDKPLSANTDYTIKIRKFDQAYIMPLNAIFKLRCVKKRRVVTENTYDAVTSYIAPTIDANLIVIRALDMINSLIP